MSFKEVLDRTSDHWGIKLIMSLGDVGFRWKINQKIEISRIAFTANGKRQDETCVLPKPHMTSSQHQWLHGSVG